MPVQATLTCVILCILSHIACSPKQPDTSIPHAVAQVTNLWPNPEQIPVCWHTVTTENEKYASLQITIQKLVTEQFNRTEKIRFVGWLECDKEYEAILSSCIGRFPKPAHCIGVERKAMISIHLNEKLPNGTFGISSIGSVRRAPPTMQLQPNKIETTAVHEFGHAIGLQHEHSRTDSPRYVGDLPNQPVTDHIEISNCADYRRGEKMVNQPELNKYLTDFDPDSVMNYCSGKNILSEKDIAAINQLYRSLEN